MINQGSCPRFSNSCQFLFTVLVLLLAKLALIGEKTSENILSSDQKPSSYGSIISAWSALDSLKNMKF